MELRRDTEEMAKVNAMFHTQNGRYHGREKLQRGIA